MNNSVNYVRKICKEKGIPVSKLEKDCGFSNGYLNPKKQTKIPYDRALIISDYLDIDVNKILHLENCDYLVQNPRIVIEKSPYYLNDETAETAQKIFEEDKVLFDVYRSADKERLVEYAKRLKSLRDMEKGEQ